MSNNYSLIIDDMTWSYSRITAFEQCRYGWLLKYIFGVEDQPRFYTQYGKYIHEILAMYYKGELKKEELSDYYISHYFENITERAYQKNVNQSYFMAGLDLFNDYNDDIDNVVAVEKKVEFKLGNRNFVGFIDLLTAEDGGLVITDHKSRNLKPRSKRKKPTKGDIELDKYLRQLYLYSVPVLKNGRENNQFLPIVSMNLHIFRLKSTIKSPFQIDEFERTKKWALDTIKQIVNNEDWSPNIDYFYCKYICGVSWACEYQNV